MRRSTVLLALIALAIGYRLYDPFEPEVIAGKKVLITGGSMGIGEQLAYHYTRLGASVMIVARSEERLKKVIENCRAIGSPDAVYLYHVADLSKSEQTERIIQEAEKSLGGIDYLVLNHIISNFGLWDGNAENITRLRDTMELNFFAYVRLASDALPILKRSSGRIVVMSSLAGKMSQMYITPYSTSKFAVNGFFSGLRLEQSARNTGVSVTVCIIGLVDTENAMKSLKDFGFTRILEMAQVAKATDVAYDILRAAALRQPELYSPYYTVNFALFLDFFSPKLHDLLTMYLYDLL